MGNLCLVGTVSSFADQINQFTVQLYDFGFPSPILAYPRELSKCAAGIELSTYAHPGRVHTHNLRQLKLRIGQ